MNIVIVAATNKELELIKRAQFTMRSNLIDFEATGVGSIATSFALSEIIASKSPDLIIQIGIGGSFSTALQLGSAVVIGREVIADLGVVEADGYKDIFELGLAKNNSFPYSNGSLTNRNDKLLEMTKLKTVAGLTVNEVSTDPTKILLFKKKYAAEVESMEGAALHYNCIMKNIPFRQIRGISNLVGERDKSCWKINEAIASASESCIQLVNNLINP
jgi:futalosine hydrolase